MPRRQPRRCDGDCRTGGRFGENRVLVREGVGNEMTVDQVLDRLAVLGEVTSRSLFGGHGIYWRGVIFGIVFEERLYLKVDDGSREDYLARGMGPFRPNERQTLKAYYEVPAGCLCGQGGTGLVGEGGDPGRDEHKR